jgi:hypothetical protein
LDRRVSRFPFWVSAAFTWWRSPRRKRRASWAPTLTGAAATVVAGVNSAEMLATDLDIVSRFPPMTDAEKDELYRSAPELGDYVCRVCDRCHSADLDPQKVFLLKGLFIRQMDDMRVTDAAWYALRERLRQWFQQAELARTEYQALAAKLDLPRLGLFIPWCWGEVSSAPSGAKGRGLPRPRRPPNRAAYGKHQGIGVDERDSAVYPRHLVPRRSAQAPPSL